MSTNHFSPTALEKAKKDVKSKSSFNKKRFSGIGVNFIADELSNKVLTGKYEFSTIKRLCTGNTKSNNNHIYHTTTLEDDVVLNSLNSIIKSYYKVKQSDRNLMVKQVISLLKEDVPKFIYRLDINDFYGNIKFSDCCDQIITDGLLSVEYEHVFNSLSKKLTTSNIKGLPRGLSISATISELHMRDFDKKIRRTNGVYFYSRFVDDIVIFSNESLSIKNDVITKLPNGLQLNWSKCTNKKVDMCLGANRCKCSKDKHLFTFLGYSFSFPQIICKKRNDLDISLSNNKYLKLKQRIHLSFSHFRNKGGYGDLRDRLEFLTSNHYLDKDRSDVYRMKAGVFYNYIQLNNIQPYKDLDRFIGTQIHLIMKSRFQLTPNNKAELIKYSFAKGFNNRTVNDYQGHHINTMKGIWND